MRAITKIILCSLLISLIVIMSGCKGSFKDVYKKDALYIDKNGRTRFDPTKIKVGDEILGWKVKSIDIQKLKDYQIDHDYLGTSKRDRKNFSAKVEFEGKVEVRGNYSFDFRVTTQGIEFAVVNFEVYPDNRSNKFPMLNYMTDTLEGIFGIEKKVDAGFPDKFYKDLTGTEGFSKNLEGEATFVIDRYVILHVDSTLNKYYGYYGLIHVVEVKDVKIIKR